MSPSSSASGYHAYEVIISYQAVIDAGVKAPLNATELSSFQEKVYRGVVGLAGHETRVRRRLSLGSGLHSSKAASGNRADRWKTTGWTA